MTDAQLARLHSFLDALRPHGLALREGGWPVEVNVSVEDGVTIVVSLRLDIDDTRIPVEAAA